MTHDYHMILFSNKPYIALIYFGEFLSIQRENETKLNTNSIFIQLREEVSKHEMKAKRPTRAITKPRSDQVAHTAVNVQ